MEELRASRTLVKSGPELWAECSDAGSLAKHLGEFGEITIIKLEPENTVAWEGDAVSGTVKLEPAGWGTRVTLTASVESPEGEDPSEGAEPSPAPEAVQPPAPEPPAPAQTAPEPPVLESEPPASEPAEPPAPAPSARQGFLRRLFSGRRRPLMPGEALPGEPPASTEPSAGADPPPPVAPAPEPQPPELQPFEPPAPERVAAAPEAPVLVSALDSLGTAHRRPFSRS